MNLLSFTLIAATLTAASAFACEGFLPKNSLRIPVGLKSTGGITQADFDAVLDEIETSFGSEIRSKGYKRFRITRDWAHPDVNASASTDGELLFTGGLARHEATTKDGFALVACHEVGHLIGGAPKYGRSVLSAESQADYFGTLKCLRRLFLNDNNKALLKRKKVPLKLAQGCHKNHPNKEDAAICIRSGLAALDVGGLLGDALTHLGSTALDTPDKTVVTRTLTDYPATNQCRLDTFIQGALCEKSYSDDVSQTDEVPGTCHGLNGDKEGLRPLCWFKPRA